MQKLQRHWEDIAAELDSCLASCKLRDRELSAASGVDYYAVRRYLASCRAKNRSANAEALCKYFGIPLHKGANVQTDAMDKIAEVLRHVWDGSEPHAELIAELIKATKAFKIGLR